METAGRLGGKPQAQEMPLALDLGPILVRRAGVQDRVVVQELDVARHEIHVEPQFGVARQFAEHVERFGILGREPARVGKPLCRTYMKPGIQHREVAGMLVKHRRFVERRLALRHLAAPVDRKRLIQTRHQVGPALRHHVVHSHRAHDRRQSARLCAPQAQQCDDIAAVNMEILAFGRRIAAQIGIGRAESFAEVVDMAEQMSLRVLRPGTAEIGSDTPIGHRTLGNRSILDGKTAHSHKAAAVEHLGTQLVEHWPECRQREILAAGLRNIKPTGPHRLHRGFDLSDLRGRKTVAPLRLVLAHIRADPGCRTFDQRSQRHACR